MTASIRPSDDLPIEPPDETIRHERRFALTDSMREEFAERARTGFASGPRRDYSIYYDTPGGALWRQGIALRVRAVDGGYLQTVQVRASDDAPAGTLRAGRIPADPFEGLQWERVTLTPMPEPMALPPEGSPVGAAIRDCLRLLGPAFEIDIQRQTRIVVPEEGVRIHLACDLGVIRAADGATESVAEVDVAQQAGPDGVFHRYALQWARLHEATLLTRTRQARGMALAGYAPDEPMPASRRPVTAEGPADVRAVARGVIQHRLEQFIDHLPAILDSTQPRGPRQLRIALRRLRAALRFFELREHRQRAADQPWRAVDAMAMELLDVSAPLCRGDRLLHDLLPVLRAAFPRDPALLRLGAALDAHCAGSRIQLREQLVAPRTTEFILLTAAALGTLDEPAAGDGRHATRLGAIDDASPYGPAGTAAPGRRAATGSAATTNAATDPPRTDAVLTTVFDSNPGGVTVWEDASPEGPTALLRFDHYAARHLSELASRVYEGAGEAAVTNDWGPVATGLRRLRQGLKIAGSSGPGQHRPQALLARLRRWESRLDHDEGFEAARETVVSAMQRVLVPDTVMARILGLVDGHRAFERHRRSGDSGNSGQGSHGDHSTGSGAGHLGSLPASTATPLADADEQAAAPGDDTALGPVERSRKLRKLLRRHFRLAPDRGEIGRWPAEPSEPVAPATFAASAASAASADPSSWAGAGRVIDLGERHRAGRGLIDDFDDLDDLDEFDDLADTADIADIADQDLRSSSTDLNAGAASLLLPPRRDPKRPTGPSNSELH